MFYDPVSYLVAFDILLALLIDQSLAAGHSEIASNHQTRFMWAQNYSRLNGRVLLRIEQSDKSLSTYTICSRLKRWEYNLDSQERNWRKVKQRNSWLDVVLDTSQASYINGVRVPCKCIPSVRSWRNSRFVSSNRRRENLCFFLLLLLLFRWRHFSVRKKTRRETSFVHDKQARTTLFDEVLIISIIIVTYSLSSFHFSLTSTPGKLSRWMYSDDGEHLYHEQVHEILNWRPFSFLILRVSLSLSHLLFIETANAWRSLRQWWCCCYCWCTHFGCLSIEVCYSFKSM